MSASHLDCDRTLFSGSSGKQHKIQSSCDWVSGEIIIRLIRKNTSVKEFESFIHPHRSG